MQIKTTTRYHLTPVQMAILKKDKKITRIDKVVKKRESSCTVDGNVNWYSHYGKQYREFPGGPVVRIQRFHCRGPSSFPGWGTKILQDAQHGQKNKKENGIEVPQKIKNRTII